MAQPLFGLAARRVGGALYGAFTVKHNSPQTVFFYRKSVLCTDAMRAIGDWERGRVKAIAAELARASASLDAKHSRPPGNGGIAR